MKTPYQLAKAEVIAMTPRHVTRSESEIAALARDLLEMNEDKFAIQAARLNRQPSPEALLEELGL